MAKNTIIVLQTVYFSQAFISFLSPRSKYSSGPIVSNALTFISLFYAHIKSAQTPAKFCSFVFKQFADTEFILRAQSTATHSLLPALCIDGADVVMDPPRRSLYPLEGCRVNWRSATC